MAYALKLQRNIKQPPTEIIILLSILSKQDQLCFRYEMIELSEKKCYAINVKLSKINSIH